MSLLLMPKATAVWLVDNTMLTFIQIGEFCKLHELEVQAIADGQVAVGIVGLDPVTNGQLTAKEIERCEADPIARLKIAKSDIPQPVARQKGPRYTPVSKRADKPDAIAWMLKNQPDLTDAQIGRLIGTTKPTIKAVRDRTHWNSSNLQPRSPVEVGLCTHLELHDAVVLAVTRAEKKRPKGEVVEAEVVEAEPAPFMHPATPEDEAASSSIKTADALFKKTDEPEEVEEVAEPTIAQIWPGDKTESA